MTSVSPIDTSGAKSASSLNKLNSNFDMFLTLLTTQLKNQDPLDPMDNAEMTNQLVQFANVEQQIAQNTNLEQMIMLLNAQSAASSVRSEEHTSELQSLMRISYAVHCLKKKK